MGKADVAVRQLDNARLGRLLQCQRVAEDRLGRPCQRRRRSDDVAHARRQRLQALEQDRLERLRHRQGTSRFDPAAPCLQGAHQLQRVERVSARGLVDSVQRRPCERRAGLVAEKPVQRTRAERPQETRWTSRSARSMPSGATPLARRPLGHQQSRLVPRPACAPRTRARARSADPATARRPPRRARAPLRPVA